MPANHNHYFSGRHLSSSNPYCCAKFLFRVRRASLLYRWYLTSRGQCTDHAADDIATLSGWHLLHGVADQAGYLRAQGIAEGAVHPLRVPSWCLQLAIYVWEDLVEYASPHPSTGTFTDAQAAHPHGRAPLRLALTSGPPCSASRRR
jgi:hypothetical protein